jgi:hypothetical protein
MILQIGPIVERFICSARGRRGADLRPDFCRTKQSSLLGAARSIEVLGSE